MGADIGTQTGSDPQAGSDTRAARGSRKLGLHDRALGLLAVRMRSRRELEQRLVRAGFERDEVAAELVRLEEAGLLDDEAFADALTEQAITSRKGGRAIANALYAKGIDRSTIDRAVEGSREGEFDRAMEFAEGRARRMTGLPDAKAFQRLSSALMRRGFSPDTSRTVARKALDVEGSDEA